MTPEIYVSLVIEEEAVNGKLLKLFNEMGATDSWYKGETKGRSIATYRYNGCAFKSEPMRGLSVEDATNYFWNHFDLERKGLLKVVQEHDLTPILSIAVYVDDITPSIHFESGALKAFSKLNIGLDIDMILSK